MVSKLKFTLYESEKGPRSILSDLATGDKLLVGRGQNVQLWINDKNISREHCQIECEDGNVYVSDLKSRNGTYLNGQRILQKTGLKDGDEIRLASTSYFVVNFIKGTEASDIQDQSQQNVNRDSHISRGATMRLPSAQEEPVDLGQTARVKMPASKGGDFSLVGEEFSGYRIEERIGSGGMAVVYRGTHLTLKRPVAIKTLSQRLLENPKAIQRFLNVAKVSSQLSHPNIVQVYDSGVLEEYGIYYLVMEYVEGQSLSDYLKDKGKMPVEIACKMISYIASALNYANKRNIIHRDINPSNILIGAEDVPKLIGLGLAKCLDDEMTALTQPGKGMGMVGYIAPEQLMDATKANHRSDLYALGATFYNVVCGQTPYDTKNMREYFNCIHNRIPPVPPYEMNNEVPRTISDMILKLLEFDIEKRYASAEDFLMELRSYMNPQLRGEGIEKARKQIMAMLPTPKKMADFDFEAIYCPAEEIGGDFYDYIELNEDEFGIVIADITGHGVEAAVVVGMVKAALKIVGKQKTSPNDVVKEVNKEIKPDLDSTTFATVFYGIINRKTKKLRFVRAGHNPLILYNPDRNPPLSTYDPKGMVIGMFTRCICEEKEIQLQQGDCLIQYTDGITEAMNSVQEEFGMDRLYEAIESTQDKGNLRQILENIQNAAKAFTGAEQQQDDITLLGIKVK